MMMMLLTTPWIGSPAVRRSTQIATGVFVAFTGSKVLTTDLLNDKDLSRILQTPTIGGIVTQLSILEARYFFFLFEKTVIGS